MTGQFKRASNWQVTKGLLAERVKHSEARGYSKQKWIEFCEAMMDRDLKLTLYEARRTWSKYITVQNGKRSFTVRFSNHRPIKSRELNEDCDFFVGVTHTGYRTTEDAIKAVDAWLQRGRQ